MGLFSFTQEIAVDLGTANTIIIHNDKIVIDEPSVVALDTKTQKLMAVGETAREMRGKVHEGIKTVRLHFRIDFFEHHLSINIIVF